MNDIELHYHDGLILKLGFEKLEISNETLIFEDHNNLVFPQPLSELKEIRIKLNKDIDSEERKP